MYLKVIFPVIVFPQMYLKVIFPVIVLLEIVFPEFWIRQNKLGYR